MLLAVFPILLFTLVRILLLVLIKTKLPVALENRNHMFDICVVWCRLLDKKLFSFACKTFVLVILRRVVFSSRGRFLLLAVQILKIPNRTIWSMQPKDCALPGKLLIPTFSISSHVFAYLKRMCFI